MAVLRNISAPGYADDLDVRTDGRAVTLGSLLLFTVGFLTSLNDVFVPHLRVLFQLSYTQAMLVQFAFFASYLLFSFPGGWLIERRGYKRTMIVGLVVMAVGAAGFLPAARYALLPIFLSALVLLAAGMAILQVAANPYVVVAGRAATAPSRLTFAQAFNSLGTVLATVAGSVLVFKGARAATPERLGSMTDVARAAYKAAELARIRPTYIGIALLLLVLAAVLSLVKLRPRISDMERTQDFRPGAFAEALLRPRGMLQSPWLLASAAGVFVYVGSEVAIATLLVPYMGLADVGGLTEGHASELLALYWLGAMLGRFIGSALLRFLRTGFVLGVAAVAAALLVFISMRAHGVAGLGTLHLSGEHLLLLPHSVALWAMLAVGLCNSVMFPALFSLGVQNLGSLTSKGSSLLVAAIAGGAVLPLAQGKLADHIGLQPSFVLPAVCYLALACLGFAATRRRPGSDALLLEDVD